MTRFGQCTAIVLVSTVLAGCRGYYVVADYGSFTLTRSPSSQSYRYFGVNLENPDQKAPAIEIMLPDGSTFRCDSLAEQDAEACFSSVERYETHFGGVKAHHMKCTDKDDVAIVFFKDGRVESVSLDEGGRFRKVGQSEFLTLPVPEEDMIRVFGKPKKYRRVYSSQP